MGSGTLQQPRTAAALEEKATDTNDAPTEQKAASRRSALLEYLVLALVAVGVALFVQAFLVKPYRIPSESMQNTLLIGDRVLVDRVSWRFSEPQRGDIVVFNPPSGGTVLIKRLVGLPGDELSLRDGALLVNGVRLDEAYVLRTSEGPVPTEPFNNGFPWGLVEPYVVPPGTYFMMGDNRINSGDSRDFGPIAREELVGPAFALYWPPGRIGGID